MDLSHVRYGPFVSHNDHVADRGRILISLHESEVKYVERNIFMPRELDFFSEIFLQDGFAEEWRQVNACCGE